MIGYIHKASNNSPIQNQFSPVVWMGADRSQDIIKDGSNKVSSWASAGKNHTATQSTGANQPTLIAGGFNGKDGVLFTAASSNFMDFGATDYFLPGTKTKDHTVILVFNTTYPAGLVEVLSNWRLAISTNAYFYGVVNANTYRFSDRVGNVGTYASDRKVATAWLSTSTNAYIYHTYSGQMPTNSYTKGSNLGTNLSDAQWQLGRQATAGEYLNGHICEVLVFDRAILITQVTMILDYLRIKYQLN